MVGEPKTLEELIKSRTYLLDFQKEALVDDLCLVQPDDERIKEIVDTIFYKLFGKGWDNLTSSEQQVIRDAWKGS